MAQEMSLFPPSPLSPPPTRPTRPALRRSAAQTPAQLSRGGVSFSSIPFKDSRSPSSGARLSLTPDEGAITSDSETGISLTKTASRTAQSVLEHFSVRGGVAKRRTPSAQATAAHSQRMKDRFVIDQVREYNEAQERRYGVKNWWKPLAQSCLPRGKLPPKEKLLQVVNNAFPPRMELPVLICDIKATGGEVRIAKLGEIEHYWRDADKPADVILRWIHAPLGQGLLHSSVEDMFRYDWPRGRPFYNAGTAGFPYLELDSVHFRDRDEIQHLRDVWEVLRPLKSLTETLNDTCLANDFNEGLANDLAWREQHLGKPRSFWDLVLPDIPIEPSESLSFQGPIRMEGIGKGEMDRSSIGTRPDQFHGAKLEVAPFRCFHRSDGILLTMSAATGVDQLHKDFRVDVREGLETRLTNSDSSVVGGIMADLVENGASSWYEHTTEWFVVYLITELGIAPQNTRSGRSALSLLSVLQNTLVDLKKKRYDSWEKKKTVRLVQEYLICMDDLKLLSLSYDRKISMFRRLIDDLAAHNAEGPRPVANAEAQPAIGRVKWAIQQVVEDKDYVDYMLADITQSLNVLFQLRSIEQNELAMVTENQNKALFIFTGVTVVFMPLSFFTSYYGMNLVGVRDITWSQSQFWEICGSATFAIIALIAICAARYQNSQTFAKLMKGKRAMKERLVHKTAEYV